MTLQDMVDAVKAHATKHYEEGGWDFVVEAFDDEEIKNEVHQCGNIEEAIAHMGKLVGAINDRRNES